MPADALNYQYLAYELDTLLQGGRIDKITMPIKYGIVVFVRANNKNYQLLISANPSEPRIHITNESFENPAVAPSFLMHLRKHIGGGRINKIIPVQFERIIQIYITSKTELGIEEDKILTIEIMGKHSNIILINNQNKVSDSIRRITPDISAKRTVLPGIEYFLPPSQDKLYPKANDKLTSVLEAFEGGKLTDYILRQVSGLSATSINAAISKTFADEIPSVLTRENVARLSSDLCGLFDAKPQPCVLESDGKNLDFFYAPYSQFDAQNIKFCDTLNEAMDKFYSLRKEQSTYGEKLKHFSTCIKNATAKCEKRLNALVKKSAECEGLEHDMLCGELITANIYRIKQGQKFVEADNYYSPDNEKQSIPLDENLSPAKNAQTYYKRYNKKKKTIEMNAVQIEKIREQADYLDSVALSLENCKTRAEVDDIETELYESGILTKPKISGKKQRLPPSKPYTIEFEGYKILCGKNNIQNDTITKNAAPFDLWLHTKDIHGSHVIVQNTAKSSPPDNVVLHAASIAAYFSKARNADKVAVDYTFAKNVSKPKGAAPGKVIYTNQHTIYTKPNGGDFI